AVVRQAGHVGVPGHGMVVRVRAGGVVPGGPPVGRFAQADIRGEDVALVGRVDPQPAEDPFVAGVGGARLARAAAPGLPGVVGHVEALVRPIGVGGLDVNAVRVAGGERDPDPAQVRAHVQPALGRVPGAYRAGDV